MFKTLNSKIDAKNVFVQLDISNLIKQVFRLETQKTSKILLKKIL